MLVSVCVRVCVSIYITCITNFGGNLLRPSGIFCVAVSLKLNMICVDTKRLGISTYFPAVSSRLLSLTKIYKQYNINLATLI